MEHRPVITHAKSFPNTSPSAKTRDYVDSAREYKEHQSKIQQAKTKAIKHSRISNDTNLVRTRSVIVQNFYKH